MELSNCKITSFLILFLHYENYYVDNYFGAEEAQKQYFCPHANTRRIDDLFSIRSRRTIGGRK